MRFYNFLWGLDLYLNFFSYDSNLTVESFIFQSNRSFNVNNLTGMVIFSGTDNFGNLSWTVGACIYVWYRMDFLV